MVRGSFVCCVWGRGVTAQACVGADGLLISCSLFIDSLHLNIKKTFFYTYKEHSSIHHETVARWLAIVGACIVALIWMIHSVLLSL